MKTISQLVKLSVLTVGVGSLLVLAAPAARAACPLLGCLTETLEEVTYAADETVEGVTGLVDETVDGTVELVEDTVQEAPGVIDETLEGAPKVTDPVEDVISPDEPPVPVPPGARQEPGRKRAAGETPVREAASSRLTDAQAERSAVVPTRPSLSPPERPGLLERIGEAAGVAARQLSFPLALSLIVVAFVLFQNYLDRKDPKLAVAPIAADVLKFE
jgi:hypothetical protein